jgi:mycothiol system anti-sigma-R factor
MSDLSEKPHCMMAMAQLEPYVDRELSEIEMVEVRLHLDECPPCARYFEVQERLKMLVHKSCPEHAPSQLVTRILDRLREN